MCPPYLHNILTHVVMHGGRNSVCAKKTVISTQVHARTHSFCTHARRHARTVCAQQFFSRTHARTHTRTHARMHARTHAHTHTIKHKTYAHTRSLKKARARTHARMHTRTHACAHSNSAKCRRNESAKKLVCVKKRIGQLPPSIDPPSHPA